MVKGITYIINADSTCSALIGNNLSGNKRKVYPVTVPDKEEPPFVTVWQTSRIPDFCKGSRSTRFTYRYEVHVFALDYDVINNISTAIIDALENADVSAPINGVNFKWKIQNMDSKDGGWIEQYKMYSKILVFEVPVHEDQAT